LPNVLENIFIWNRWKWKIYRDENLLLLFLPLLQIRGQSFCASWQGQPKHHFHSSNTRHLDKLCSRGRCWCFACVPPHLPLTSCFFHCKTWHKLPSRFAQFKRKHFDDPYFILYSKTQNVMHPSTEWSVAEIISSLT